ncbi:thioesterase II family protein [Microbulbifer taiwanensis]|uniref:Thioesterase II family protein n=1 Tax=Microbulbifer taiwanensis TaxID=986746 RepID=A0ABW1YJ58_9GAMM|nr:alpha/beta fold hydrolase [Microbulbifer taiwanensis]
MSSARPALDLFCLPCAGASATMYLRWRRQLPAWIRVLPLELPGRGSRLGEPFVEDFRALVSLLCEEIYLRAPGRWAIFGHSMGALLAFGVAARLQRLRATAPEMLIVSASPAPAHRDPQRYPDTLDEAALIADLRRQGGTPPAVFDSPELLRMTLDTLAADYRVCESLDSRPGAPLQIPVQVFAGRDDAIAPAAVEAWREETESEFSLQWFDGGHFFIRQQEAQLLQALERRLRRLVREEDRLAAPVSA